MPRLHSLGLQLPLASRKTVGELGVRHMKNWRELRKASINCRYRTNDVDGAIRYLRDAIESAAQSEPSEVPLMLNSLSNLLASIGDFSGAENAARKSIDEERKFGFPINETDSLGSFHSALAITLHKQGKYLEALTALDEAIRIYALHVGENEILMKNLRGLRLELEKESWRG